MVHFALEEELRDSVAALAPEQQRQVLAYARSLGGASGQGVPGQTLLRFAGSMSREDAAEITRAVEEDCETVNPDGW
jgi:hypothetical protein